MQGDFIKGMEQTLNKKFKHLVKDWMKSYIDFATDTCLSVYRTDKEFGFAWPEIVRPIIWVNYKEENSALDILAAVLHEIDHLMNNNKLQADQIVAVDNDDLESYIRNAYNWEKQGHFVEGKALDGKGTRLRQHRIKLATDDWDKFFSEFSTVFVKGEKLSYMDHFVKRFHMCKEFFARPETITYRSVNKVETFDDLVKMELTLRKVAACKGRL